MRTIQDLIKPKVRKLAPYTLTPHRTRIKLNQNENPFDMPESVKTEVLHRLAEREWSRYPDFIPVQLQETLARFAGWRADGVLVGNGSNELIQNLLMVMVAEGTPVVLSEPTFTVYRLMVETLGGEVVNIPPRADLSYDLAAIGEAACRTNAAAVILCSPNNPTGVTVSEADVRRLLAEFDGLVVVDEAYYEFCGQNFVRLLAEFPRLVVLRTFSKAMAMAGLRVGYLLGAPELVIEVNKAKLPYNLNFFSMAAATVAVEQYETALKPLVELLIAERHRLETAFQELPGFRLVPSAANFMLVEALRHTPKEVFESLLAESILIRDVSRYPLLERYFRFNVGTPAENDAFLAGLRLLSER
ncbi:MAG: histidinol-phosphate transaminase [Blastocatellia bacterium]|nr:histidinol-phosphate transaminase [Blastocatellia bacterium]